MVTEDKERLQVLQAEMAPISKWMNSLTDAVAWRDCSRAKALGLAVAKLKILSSVLAATGVAKALATVGLQVLICSETAHFARHIIEKWRKEVADQPIVSGLHAIQFLNGLSVPTFSDRVAV